jgi:WD40 repeat protein
VLAQQAARDARSRELIASALATKDRDGSLAKLLAVEAAKGVGAPTRELTSVLHQVLAADPIVARYTWPKDHPAPGLFTSLSQDGKLLVATGTARVEVADPRTGKVLWSWPSRDLGLAPDTDLMSGGLFSADGTEVITGLWWGKPDVAPPAGISLGVANWNAQTGELKRTIHVGPCGAAVPTLARNRALVWTPLPGPDGKTGCHWPDDGIAPLSVLDLATGSMTALADRATYNLANGTLSGDGRFAGFDLMEAGTCGASCFTSVVLDLDHGRKRVFRLEQEHGATSALYARQLNEDGTLFVYGDRPTYVYRIVDGAATRIATWTGTGGNSDNPVFDPTDQTILQTSRDGTLRRWDPMTGQILSSWSAVGSGPTSVAADGRTVLVTNQVSGTAVLLDIGDRGDLGQVESCRDFTMGGSLRARAGVAAFGENCPDGHTVVQVVDPQQRTTVAKWRGWWSQDLAISPDGRLFVSQEAGRFPIVGPLVVANIATGMPVVALQGACQWDSGAPPDKQTGCETYPKTPFAFGLPSASLRWSPDGTMIAAISNTSGDPQDGHLIVWNALDGRLIYGDTETGVYQVAFTPDSQGLVESMNSQLTGAVVKMRSTATWTVVRQAKLDTSVFGIDQLGLVGFTADGSTILGVGGFGAGQDSTLIWLDSATLKITKTVAHAHNGSVKSMALSPDGSLMATGASDGILRVWDTETGALSQQMDFGGREVQGVAFIDNRHLAVTPQGADLLIMTVDPAELEGIVRASLIRTFTATECTTYNIDPCPTLEQMRAGN